VMGRKGDVNHKRNGTAKARPPGFFNNFEYAFDDLFYTITPPIRYSPVSMSRGKDSSEKRFSFRPWAGTLSSLIR